MPKCGIRGTATARLAFHDMPVPAENVLGPGRQGPAHRPDRARLRPHHVRRQLHRRGQGLPRGRRSQHAKRRVQFKQPLGEFELVKKKIAYMAAHAFAMEATTTQCAAFIDRGSEDYMLETAMLKVWSDRGAVDRSSTTRCRSTAARATSRDRAVRTHDARRPHQPDRRRGQRRAARRSSPSSACAASASRCKACWRRCKTRSRSSARSGASAAASRGPLQDAGDSGPSRADLQGRRSDLAARVRDFGLAIPQVLAHFRKKAPGAAAIGRARSSRSWSRPQEPVHAGTARGRRLRPVRFELHAEPARPSAAPGNGNPDRQRQIQAGRYFLTLADRRIRQNLAELWDNLDAQTTLTADVFLKNPSP